MKHIFLLEDDETLGRGIAMALTGPETSVVCRPSLAKAREALAENRFDLLILDVNLPDGSGLDLLRQVRAEGDATPVVLLTANDLELDEVTGLEAGADDYITKPFSLAVLRARVNAQLRRGVPKVSPPLSAGPFAFDFERMDFRRDGRPWNSPKPSRRCCGCWWKIGDMPCPGPRWWTGYGRTERNLWRKTPCPSRSSGCGASWRLIPPSRNI